MAMLLFPAFLAMLLLGVPVAMAVGASTVLAFINSPFSDSLYIIPLQIIDGVDKASLVSIPFFIFAGNLMNACGMTDRIFNFAEALVGHMKAGLAQVNVLSSMIFAGASGAAVADCAGLGAIEIKAMKERGYKPEFAAAVTVSSAVIGPLIPPSVGLVIYAFLAEQSVQRMFLAGVMPGLLVGGLLMIFIRILASFNEFPVQPRAPITKVAALGKHGLFALVAPGIIITAIFTGWVTATEAGVLACLYSILLGTLVYRTLSFKKFMHALTETTMMTTVIMLIIGFSIAMSWLLAIEHVPQQLAQMMFGLTEDKSVFLILLIAFILVIGCVVEGVPAKLMLVPTLLPITAAYGIDRVHLGLVLQLGLLIGLATPPMGVGLYIMVEVGKVKFERVAVAVLPFLIPLITVLIVITFIPEIVTWLPNYVLGPDMTR